MVRDKHIVTLSAAELNARRTQGQISSDLARVRAKTEEELERDIASDPDLRDIPEDWYKSAEAVMPSIKKLISLRLDSDVLDWFRRQGPGYQTRMNAVLRTYVQHASKERA